MKSKNLRILPTSFSRICLSTTCAAFCAIQSASAADGTWTADASGLWSTPGNWMPGDVADGSGFTANFNTIDITADRTVSLDGDRTLTNLIFGDTETATTPAGWLLDNNGDDTNNLILAGTAPTITVNPLGTGKAAGVSAVIEGSVGLTKAGSGTLVLAAANAYSGGTGLVGDVGIVQATHANGFGTGTVTVRPGGTSGAARLNVTIPESGVGSSAGDPNVFSNAFNLGGQGNPLVSGGFGAIQNVSGFNRISGNITRSNTGGTSYNIVSKANSLELTGQLSSSQTGTRAFNFGGAGDIVVTGAIINGSGTTAVAKDGTGNLTLTGNKAFTGGLTVRSGSVFARSSGGALGGAGTGGVTLGNTSGSDSVSLLLATSSIFNNPITVAAGSSGSVTVNNFANYSPTLGGTITLNKDLILRNTNGSGGFNLTVSGTVGGAGGLQINSSNANNTVTFSGTGNYNGATTVNGGVFALTGSLTASSVEVMNNATLSGTGNIAGDLTIRSGARHALAVAATEGAQVTRAITGILTLDSGNILDLTAAAPPAAGTYVLATATDGITGTPTVVNKTGLSGDVTVDTVSSPNRLLLTVGSGFSTWITGTFANGNTVPGGQLGPYDDPDGDGVSNLEEYAVAGFDPTLPNGSIGSFASSTLTISKRQPLATDITYSIEESIDLGTGDPWQEVPAGINYTNDGTTISYLLPGRPQKNFLRLKVVKP